MRVTGTARPAGRPPPCRSRPSGWKSQRHYFETDLTVAPSAAQVIHSSVASFIWRMPGPPVGRVVSTQDQEQPCDGRCYAQLVLFYANLHAREHRACELNVALLQRAT